MTVVFYVQRSQQERFKQTPKSDYIENLQIVQTNGKIHYFFLRAFNPVVMKL